MLLRLDPELHDALSRWAADELRSTNAHVEWLLRRALGQAGRLPPADGPRRGGGDTSGETPGETPGETSGGTPGVTPDATAHGT